MKKNADKKLLTATYDGRVYPITLKKPKKTDIKQYAKVYGRKKG